MTTISTCCGCSTEGIWKKCAGAKSSAGILESSVGNTHSTSRPAAQIPHRKSRARCQGGVINTHEDSDDPDEYSGEQKEIAKEAQELRAAQDWINQDGWDASSEGVAWSPRSGTQIDLRLDWGEVERKLASGTDRDVGVQSTILSEGTVVRDDD